MYDILTYIFKVGLLAYEFFVAFLMLCVVFSLGIFENNLLTCKLFLAFLFPNGTDMNLLRICEEGKKKNFCKDCVSYNACLL